MPAVITERHDDLLLSQRKAHSTVILDYERLTEEKARFFDPASVVSVCPFDLANHPIRVRAQTGNELLTMSFHSYDGRVFYALSDKAAQKGAIEIILMNRRQLDVALNLDVEDEAVTDVRLLSPVQKGFIVVRVLSLLPGERPAALEQAKQLSCKPDASILSATDP
ncbi:MAG: hypothetical protein ACRCYS_00360 [Beijerinckiaceae bacterium]